MKDCKISDDGKVTGTAEEVLAYEAGLANPLSRMRFPYHIEATWPHDNLLRVFGANGITAEKEEAAVVIAFANLAPLIHEWAERCPWFDGDVPDEWRTSSRKLQDALHAACKRIPK